jgi:hypothetical protein
MTAAPKSPLAASDISSLLRPAISALRRRHDATEELKRATISLLDRLADCRPQCEASSVVEVAKALMGDPALPQSCIATVCLLLQRLVPRSGECAEAARRAGGFDFLPLSSSWARSSSGRTSLATSSGWRAIRSSQSSIAP